MLIHPPPSLDGKGGDSTNHKGDHMTTYAYTRVSSQRQADSGIGLQAQQDTITRAAQDKGLTIERWFEDAGIGGAKGLDEDDRLDLEKRPGLMSAMEALQKGDILLVANRSRLARDQLLATLLDRAADRKGARIVSAAGEGTDESSPTSLLIRGIMDLVSSYNRAIIRAGVKAAMRAKRDRGERVSQIPYGMRLRDGTKLLEPDPHEQAGLARLKALRASGATLQATAGALEAEGYRPKRGGQWHPDVLARILKRA